MIKRMMDLFVAALLLTLSTPFLLIAMLLVLVVSGRPVFFIQQRVGRDGKIFKIVKLRSMTWKTVETNGVMQYRPEVDWVGRFLRQSHLDEIPQFWNVLRGDMSIIGPRPHTAAEVPDRLDAYGLYSCRASVRPGMVGLAQALPQHLRNSYRHNGRMDHFYVSHKSLCLDIIALGWNLRIAFLGRKP